MDARIEQSVHRQGKRPGDSELWIPWPGSVCSPISEMPRPKPMTLWYSTKPISCRQIGSQTFRVRKTDRYKLAEAIAGADVDDEQWTLHWSAHHLLLAHGNASHGSGITPTTYLWRLLLPDSLQTKDAFDRFPPNSRRDHFVRRTKEEMVHFDGTAPLSPTKLRHVELRTHAAVLAASGNFTMRQPDYILGYYNRARSSEQILQRDWR